MIINTVDAYNNLVQRMHREAFLSTPIFRDMHRHPADNQILCIGVSFSEEDFYMVSISHRDAPQFGIPPLDNRVDPDILLYINGAPVRDLSDFYPPIIRSTHSLFPSVQDINRVVPITSFSETVRAYHQSVFALGIGLAKNSTYRFMESAVRTLRRIEGVGVHVDGSVFRVHFPNHIGPDERQLVYTQYYPYTSTGRPSNRYGGVNFSALNKTDTSRAAFTSRFPHGTLVQLDFESYHLRLIAQYGGISVPSTSIHQYLASEYYQTDDVTPEQYAIGKEITFGIIYGEEVETDIPLLQKIQKISNELWDTYLATGQVQFPVSGRVFRQEALTKNKLFNYFIQNQEFEVTVQRLQSLVDQLESYRSKLILYTYDAILLDVHPDELDDVVRLSKLYLGHDTFPLREYRGVNYHDMLPIN